MRRAIKNVFDVFDNERGNKRATKIDDGDIVFEKANPGFIKQVIDLTKNEDPEFAKEIIHLTKNSHDKPKFIKEVTDLTKIKILKF